MHDLNKYRISQICVTPDTTIEQAMRVMSKHSVRLVLICETDGTFRGLIADGDIRRYLLSGHKISDTVKAAGIKSPKVLTELRPLPQIQAMFETLNVEYLPYIVDDKVERMFALLPWRAPSSVHVVIMAGGLGMRLRPFTDNCPKPLVEVGGIPILTRSLNRLIEQGVNEFTICINYLGNMIIDQYGDGSELGVNIQYVREKKSMGTGGGLSMIEHSLSDPFIVINGDIITDIRVEDIINSHRSGGWKATMITREYSLAVPYGVVETDSDDGYLGAIEKPEYRLKINTGIYVLDKTALDYIPKDKFYDLPRLFEDLKSNQVPVGCHLHEGQWIDVGNQAELELANSSLKSKVKIDDT